MFCYSFFQNTLRSCLRYFLRSKSRKSIINDTRSSLQHTSNFEQEDYDKFFLISPFSNHTLPTLSIKRFFFFLKPNFIVRNVWKLAWIGKNIAGWPTLNSLTQSHLSFRNGKIDFIDELLKAFPPDIASSVVLKQWEKELFKERTGSLSTRRQKKKQQANGSNGSKH